MKKRKNAQVEREREQAGERTRLKECVSDCWLHLAEAIKAQEMHKKTVNKFSKKMKLGYWACIHNVLRQQHFHYTTIERENANHGVSVEIMWLQGEEENGPKPIPTMLFRICAPLLIISEMKRKHSQFLPFDFRSHSDRGIYHLLHVRHCNSYVLCFSPECIFKGHSKNCIRSKEIMQWLLFLINGSKRVRSNQPFGIYDVLTAHKHTHTHFHRVLCYSRLLLLLLLLFLLPAANASKGNENRATNSSIDDAKSHQLFLHLLLFMMPPISHISLFYAFHFFLLNFMKCHYFWSKFSIFFFAECFTFYYGHRFFLRSLSSPW